VVSRDPSQTFFEEGMQVPSHKLPAGYRLLYGMLAQPVVFGHRIRKGLLPLRSAELDRTSV
jgi:hypothetical protein